MIILPCFALFKKDDETFDSTIRLMALHLIIRAFWDQHLRKSSKSKELDNDHTLQGEVFSKGYELNPNGCAN